MNGIGYHRESLKSYIDMLTTADKKYGLNISLKADEHRAREQNPRVDLTEA